MSVCRLYKYPEMMHNLVDFHSLATYTIVAVSAGIYFVHADIHYLCRRRRLCFWCGLFVCLSVCPSVYSQTCEWILTKFFGGVGTKDQVIQFWWRSGSRFGYGSPASEIRILRIGGGLCSLSAFLVIIVK